MARAPIPARDLERTARIRYRNDSDLGWKPIGTVNVRTLDDVAGGLKRPRFVKNRSLDSEADHRPKCASDSDM